MEKPTLRTDIQMIMTRLEGRRVVVFQDPYELSRQQLAVDAGALPLLQMLDGRHGIRDIQRELTNRGGGRLVYLSDIESFLESLDGAFLLDSEAYRREMDSLLDTFSRDERRPCAHAGKSYDSDPERLARFIEESEAALPDAGLRPSEIHALVAPHIDLRVARSTYAGAYRHLKGRSYDLVVILGINHHAQDGLFCISSKNYVTPFGETRTDRGFVHRLKDRAFIADVGTGDDAEPADQAGAKVAEDIAEEVVGEEDLKPRGIEDQVHGDLIDRHLLGFDEGVFSGNFSAAVEEESVAQPHHGPFMNHRDLVASGPACIVVGVLGNPQAGLPGDDLECLDHAGDDLVFASRIEAFGILSEDDQVHIAMPGFKSGPGAHGPQADVEGERLAQADIDAAEAFPDRSRDRGLERHAVFPNRFEGGCGEGV